MRTLIACLIVFVLGFGAGWVAHQTMPSASTAAQSVTAPKNGDFAINSDISYGDTIYFSATDEIVKQIRRADIGAVRTTDWGEGHNYVLDVDYRVGFEVAKAWLEMKFGR